MCLTDFRLTWIINYSMKQAERIFTFKNSRTEAPTLNSTIQNAQVISFPTTAVLNSFEDECHLVKKYFVETKSFDKPDFDKKIINYSTEVDLSLKKESDIHKSISAVTLIAELEESREPITICELPNILIVKLLGLYAFF